MCQKCLIGAFLVFLLVTAGAMFLLLRNAGAETFPILINEVAWMGTSTSANDEWIELYNASDFSIDLNGWRLEAMDSSPVITLDGSVPPGGYFLLERTDDTSVQDIPANQIYAGALSNTGERLRLFNSSGIIQNEIDASDGWPAGDSVAKATAERGTTGAWHTGPVGGTPKAPNSIPVPNYKKPGVQTTQKNNAAAPIPEKPAPQEDAQDKENILANIGTKNPEEFTLALQQNTEARSLAKSLPLIAGALLASAFVSAIIFFIKRKRQ